MAKAPPYPGEDLFEGTKMTFGEHLEELRSSLFKAVLGLVLMTLPGFYFANDLVLWIQTPLESALREFYLTKATKDLAKRFGGTAPPELLAVVEERQLLPDFQFVDQQSLEAGLRGTDATGSDLPLIANRIDAHDLAKEGSCGLCQALLAASASEQPSPALRVWQALTPEEQATVRGATDASDEATVAKVIAALNRVAGDAALAEAEEFTNKDWLKRLKPSRQDAIKSLRASLEEASEAGRPELTRRLNRQLLSAALPENLNVPQPRLLELVTWKKIRITMQALSPHEVFNIWMKAAFLLGALLASPWIFYQIWRFVAAGLYPHEKRFVHLYGALSLLLFFAGAAMAFAFVFAPVLKFLFSYNDSMNIAPEPRINEWLGFVLILPLGFGISFQLPLVMLFFHRIGVMSIETYFAKWRVAVLAIFVISMVLTPADPVSMLLMAGPLSFLYFFGIGLCKWLPRGRNPFADAYEPS